MPDKPRKVAVTIFLDADIKAQLDALSEDYRRTAGQTINFILMRWFKSRPVVEDLIWALYAQTPKQMAEDATWLAGKPVGAP